MTYAVRAQQARCAALGYWPGPIDGEMGKRTRAALDAAAASQRAKGRPFFAGSGLSRLHIHWSAGGGKASALDRQHYHVLIEDDGSIIRAHAATMHLAHTLNANGGAIAVSLCAMRNAVERPFSAGPSPITAVQLKALACVAADLCAVHDIPVTRWSVLTHAEIQPTLGIKQRGKWDVCWLPGMSSTADPITVGDRLRALIRAAP